MEALAQVLKSYSLDWCVIAKEASHIQAPLYLPADV